ncbi:MAG: hypothetical protein MJB14_10960 [Spirochaetes bacterium]|nr:hypothetical protein [Spirochaetota bacterium]
MNRIVIIIYLCIILATSPAANEYDALFADLSTDAGNSKKGSHSDFNQDNDLNLPQFTLSLTGEHNLNFHIPFIPDELNWDTYTKAPKFQNQFGIEIHYKILKLISNWQLDLIMKSSGNWQEILEAAPLENYLSLTPWKFTIKAGFQEFSWGTADGFNPTDHINPVDMRGGLSTEKIPVLSLYVGFYPLDWLSIESIYIPFTQKDRFFENIPDMIEENFSEYQTDVTEQLPDFDFTSFQLGGKVNFFFRYADFSFSYLYDLDSAFTPDFSLTRLDISSQFGLPSGMVTTYIPQSIKLSRKRVHQFGADFKTTAQIFGIWAELCYSLTEDYLLSSHPIRNHTLSWCTGFDFNYGPDDGFYFSLQYTGEYIPAFDQTFYKDYDEGLPDVNEKKGYYEEYYSRLLVNQLAGINQGLSQGLIINTSWEILNNKLTPELTVAYFLPLLYDSIHEKKFGSLFIEPKLDIQPIDSLHIIIGGELYFSWHQLAGEDVQIYEADQIGANYGNSSIYLEVKYKWGFEFHK